MTRPCRSSALSRSLESAHRSGRPEAIQEAVERSLEQLTSSITALQSLITELRPASLDELGLKPALEALMRRAAASSGLEVETHFDLAYDEGREPSRLTGEIESTAYRLVQEAVTNALKHADAEHVRVEAVESGESLHLTIRDDGKGFDTSQATGGFGLIGMRERVELVNGRLLIDSAAEGGTVVRAELPAAHEPSSDSDPGSAAHESM